MKQEYIEKINDLINQYDDLSMLDLVCKILEKGTRITHTT
jgi:hypothetical protein